MYIEHQLRIAERIGHTSDKIEDTDSSGFHFGSGGRNTSVASSFGQEPSVTDISYGGGFRGLDNLSKASQVRLSKYLKLIYFLSLYIYK
jgi:hypothetical protein